MRILERKLPDGTTIEFQVLISQSLKLDLNGAELLCSEHGNKENELPSLNGFCDEFN